MYCIYRNIRIYSLSLSSLNCLFIYRLSWESLLVIFEHMYLYVYGIVCPSNITSTIYIYTSTRPTSKPEKTLKHDNATDQQLKRNRTSCKPEI